MVPTLWGMTVYNHEDTIYLILEYVQKKEAAMLAENQKRRAVQEPWSSWAVYEIIGELKMDENSYADEVVRRFIRLMDQYEEVAEPERKTLFRTAKATAEDLYSYLFEEGNKRKETIPF